MMMRQKEYTDDNPALTAAAGAAKAGNRLLDIATFLLVALMLLYGGYSLWDTWMTYSGAFLGSELMAYKPDGSDLTNPSLADLIAINPDVVGWITIDDTGIDYPFVQGDDNADYINTDIYGEFSLSGAIFLDYSNARDFSDTYSLLYGHHISGGAMFSDIVEFTEEDYFDEHTTGTLYLVGATYAIDLFACYEADAYDTNIYLPARVTQDSLDSFLAYLENGATQWRDIGAGTGDKIIGLSTCADATTNGRVVLFGRLTQLTETVDAEDVTTTVDTATEE